MKNLINNWIIYFNIKVNVKVNVNVNVKVKSLNILFINTLSIDTIRYDTIVNNSFMAYIFVFVFVFIPYSNSIISHLDFVYLSISLVDLNCLLRVRNHVCVYVFLHVW